MRRVVINKRSFAVGLLWFTPDSNDRANPIALRKLAASEASRQDSGLDLVAFRKRQFGLGASKDTLSNWSKTRALAAALKVPTSFLGLFKLEDVDGVPFWWVYACTSGILSEQADALFENYDEAKMYINQSLVSLLGEFDEQIECESHLASQTWMAPLLRVSFGHGFSLYDVSRLTPIRHSPEHQQKIMLVAAVVVLGAVGLYAASAYFEHKAAQQALESAHLATRSKELRRQELEKNPERAFPAVWASASRADLFAQACLQTMFAQSVFVSGWELTEASCTQTTLTVSLEHRPGADFQRLPHNAQLVNTHRATLSSPVTTPQSTRTDSEYHHLLARETATRFWYQLTQQLGSRLRFDMIAPARTTIDGIELTAPWQRGTWELTEVPDAVLLDGSLFTTLAQLPGLVVDRIVFANNSWTLKGAVYVQK